MDELARWTEGESLLPFANGSIRSNPVLMEYAAEASYAPLISIRKGPFNTIDVTWILNNYLMWKVILMSCIIWQVHKDFQRSWRN